MENEEKEDLLLEVTESDDDPYEKEDCDCYIEEKILSFVQKEKQNHKSTKKTYIFITACLFMFLSSSVLVISLPIYLQYSNRSGIQTYSKLVTLSTANAAFFCIIHLTAFLFKWITCKPTGCHLRLPNVLKTSISFSAGSIIIFWLTDGNYVSCHLQDPLKGCAVVFSLLFYFVLSRKRMSVERIFCAVTVIVGVFVTIDFGICDKFRCNGSSITLADDTPTLHFLYVVLYVLAHGIWVLHFSYMEIFWTGFQKGKIMLHMNDLLYWQIVWELTSRVCAIKPVQTYPLKNHSFQQLCHLMNDFVPSFMLQCSNSNLSLSVLSNVSKNTVCDYDKQQCRSLSVICHEGGGIEKNNPSSTVHATKKSLLPSRPCQNNRILKNRRAISENSPSSAPCTNQVSVSNFKEFPITSTPVHGKDVLDSGISANCFDVVLWQHIICCIIIMSLCWLPTISFLHDGNPKLLVEVVSEIGQSFSCHSGLSDNLECNYLFVVTVIMSFSYLIFALSSLEVLKCSQSAVTVINIMMLSLPMSSLWWSLYRLNRNYTTDVLEFSPEITGEAVCAMLGFPIIGIGSLLLLKSHIREFKLLA